MKGGFNVRLLCFVAISLFAPRPTLAGSIYRPQHVVRPTFAVIVLDRGRHVSGVDVELQRWHDINWRYEVVKSVQSDVDGRALFFGAPLGEYRVRVSHGFVRGGDADPKVVRRGKAEAELELSWPAAQIHVVQAARGAFTIAETKEPLSGAAVSLIDTETGRIVRKAVANERGEYDFDGVRPGLYSLNISEPTEEEGYLGIVRDIVFESVGIQKHGSSERDHIHGNILIEVKDKAVDRELPRGALSMTDCGMSYEPERTAHKTN